MTVVACGEEAANAPPPNQPVRSTVATGPNPTFSPPAPVQSAAPATPVAMTKSSPTKVTLTADECSSAQKKLEAFKQEDMTTKDSLELFLFVKAANCATAPPTVTASQRECLGFPNYAKASFVVCADASR